MPNLTPDCDQTVNRLVSDRVASRIWNKDASLWPAESHGAEPAAEIMGWLELPYSIQTGMEPIKEIVSKLRVPQRTGEEITDLVVMGMGGSSMTPEVLRVLFDVEPIGVRLHVLDTVHPETIGSITRALPLNTTAFAVCSKSGTTVEPLSLEKHFRQALAEAGIKDPPRQLIAISDIDTPLSKRAQDGEFAHWIETPRDVGGRFSALTAFGMLPAVALGLDSDRLGQSAREMADRCKIDSVDNPGLKLGACLGTNALAGRDKVTLITSPGIERFGLWIEQLLAESTGKNGKGLVPIAGEPLLDPEYYGKDRNFLYIRLESTDNAATDAHVSRLRSNGHPVTTLEFADLYDLGGEFFRWEFATAVAGHILEIFPFDQPDVNAAKEAARAILDSGALPSATSEVDLKSAIAQLIETPKAGDYVAIGAFMPESPEADQAFTELRTRITRKTGMATTFGFGPRYLHSIGQLYKGGPNTMRFLGVVSHGSVDIKVPGEQYTLGALTPAQAYGDFEVMRDIGRRIKTAVLGKNSVVEIEEALTD